MAYKTRLTWIGWCIAVLLLTVNFCGLAYLSFGIWRAGGVAAGAAPEPLGVSLADLLPQLISFVVLLNLFFLPLLLLNIRLNRNNEYY